MDNPELIIPGDRVFLAVPVDLERSTDDYAFLLDETYPGVDFEVVECDGQRRPEIVFTYRDPRALDRWLADQKIVEAAENGVGITPA